MMDIILIAIHVLFHVFYQEGEEPVPGEVELTTLIGTGIGSYLADAYFSLKEQSHIVSTLYLKLNVYYGAIRGEVTALISNPVSLLNTSTGMSPTENIYENCLTCDVTKTVYNMLYLQPETMMLFQSALL